MTTFILLVLCFWIPVSVAAAPIVGKVIAWSAK